MLARSRSKLYQLFQKRLYSMEKSTVAEQQFILIDLLILDKLNFHWLILYNVN
jgi:hypothetical protein